MGLIYPKGSAAAHPSNDSPGYKSTSLRHPRQPLVLLPHTLSEITGPVYGHETLRPGDDDLTRQHAGEPLGERIIVRGRVLDEDGRPVPNTLVEVWQANAAGRYIHVKDQHPAPLDPNFTGAGRAVTDAEGRYLMSRAGKALYTDRSHLSPYGSRELRELFEPLFEEIKGPKAAP